MADPVPAGSDVSAGTYTCTERGYGLAGFVGEEPVTELEVFAVGVEQRVRPMRTELEQVLRDERNPVITPQGHDLTVGPVLMTEPALIAVASGHRLTRRTSVSPEDLRGETILSVRHLPPYWIQHHHAAEDREPATVKPPLPATTPEVSGFQELLTFVAAGRGVAVVGEQSAAYYTRPGLTCLPCADLPSFRYAIVWRTAVHDANATAFVHHANRLNKTC